jgi:hypothetical protein
MLGKKNNLNMSANMNDVIAGIESAINCRANKRKIEQCWSKSYISPH